MEEALSIIYPLATATGKQALPRAIILAASCLNSLQRYMEALNLISLTEMETLRPREMFELHLVQGNAYFALEEWLSAVDSYFEAYRLNEEDAENAFAGVLQLEPENKNVRLFLGMM